MTSSKPKRGSLNSDSSSSSMEGDDDVTTASSQVMTLWWDDTALLPRPLPSPSQEDRDIVEPYLIRKEFYLLTYLDHVILATVTVT